MSMSTAPSNCDEVPSESNPSGPCEGPLEDDDDDDDAPTMNNVASLKQGNIESSGDKPYTLLLVGETGVGKSSVLEFIANVLHGRDVDRYDFDILDPTNEQRGSENQSQTNSARLYELKSKNGIVVRILDTPGLADTRGIEQDERHRESIATQIQDHIDSITAVLILTNGTVPRVTVSTDYALSTLSTIFPKSLASNIAFVFTNVLSPLHRNISKDTLPDLLKDAPQFSLNNPIALQKKYLALQGNPNMKKTRMNLYRAVKDGEQSALEMLVDLFDWLDSLDPRPTAETVPLYKGHDKAKAVITNTAVPVDPAMAGNEKASVFPKTILAPISEQEPASNLDYICTVPGCHYNCSMQLSSIRVLVGKLLPWIQLKRCPKCTHPYLFHFHMSLLQGQKTTKHVVDDAKHDPPPFFGDYAGRWPSEGLSARVAKAIQLLEESHKAMEEKGVGQEQLGNMKSSLKRMKKKLDLLRKAKTWCRKDSESEWASKSLSVSSDKY